MPGDSALVAGYFLLGMRWSDRHGLGAAAVRWLSVAALSTVSCANEGEWVDATQAPEVKFDAQRQGCLVEIGCLSQPLALPDCWSGAALDDRPTDARVGQRVVLEGYLHVVEWAQTAAQCPVEQPCCKGDSARLVLTTQGGPVWLADRRRPLAFSCSGDRSLACCAFDSLGSRVKARGVLARHEQKYFGHVIPGYRLDEPELCRVGKS